MATTKRRGALSRKAANALSLLSSSGLSLFTLRDFASAIGSGSQRPSKLLHELQRSGWVARVAREKYLVVPLEAGPDSVWTEDALVVVGHLAEPSAIAYWTACHYWNWTEQPPRTVFAQTTRRVWRNASQVLGVPYRLVRVKSRKFFGIVKRTSGGGTFAITDREKTLVDALDRPDLCGGIHQVAEMLPAVELVSWERIDQYLERTGSGAIYKRLGLLVEALGSKVSVPKRKRRLEVWRSKLTGGHAPLEPAGPSRGPVNRRWRVRLNVGGVIPEVAAR